MSGAKASFWGSSPLTRGKRQDHPTPPITRGLIPAHAGKTAEEELVHVRPPAHPRSRGENAAGIASVALTQGSSPLTRGKLKAQMHEVADQRLIPAHAGKTSHARAGGLVVQAHPRSRGENSIPFITRIGSGGSSPLTRGKHQGHPARERRRRLIPAHAGKTK